MATLTLTLVAGATSTQAMTFSGADASRILAAYQSTVQPNGTAADLLAWLSGRIKRDLTNIVTASETVQPTPPTIS
jgi:D-serine deaminase-like pyridoxal phosphate-dependent protein